MPPPSVREELTGGRTDVLTRFAEADAAFAEGGGEGQSPSAAFDAAMTVLERAGMGPDGRAAVEQMFQPARRQDELSATRFRQVTETLRRIAELVSQRPDLASATGQDHYEGTVMDLRREVAAAYRRGETLEGHPLRGADPLGLADAIARMDRAFDDYLAAAATDPIERLFGLLRLRDEVARAGEILRHREPGFRATVSPGEAVASTLLPDVPGVREIPLDVLASGRISEPLARDLPGVGLERYMLTPAEIGALHTEPEGLAERLALMLQGYHRAHLIGPGFGGELFEGLMLAPEHVNLQAQNEGVEHFIRSAAEAGVEVTLDTQAHGSRLEVPLEGGEIEHVDILSSVEYRITGVVGDGDPVTFIVRITVGPPPGGAVEIHSTIPQGAPGADVLATFRQMAPVP